ncbi:hypothetical protein [Peribacillus frigoritolerans]|uniref:hypothetical protein n=1 Tax=Peribacillus frigoritolerans TaxID=450367 RepID=UPI00119A3640|nr:hypothetical protein [Peribacillus frigoritolerans]MDG4850363.1 hypothetical protein [Peribacillus frigoritolerans]TWE00627.1 hypothetical protein FB545_2964 [Peribacillus frigoritolerans]
MPNHVQNGGFEQSTAASTNPSPFWTGINVLVEGNGNQLLGTKNIRIDIGGSLSQALLPLEIGREYTFKAASRIQNFANGTLDVFITGSPSISFRTTNMTREPYAFYEFDFTATNGTPTLTIINASDDLIRLDVVSVKPVKL